MSSQEKHSYNTATIKNHRFESHFTQLPNSTLRDEKLSFGASGLLSQILSYPDGWEVKLEHLSRCRKTKKKGNGLEAVRGMIQELKEVGYVTYTVSRNEKGHWVHSYDCYPMPFEEIKIKFPEGVKPSSDDPSPVNASLSRTLEVKNTVSKKTSCSSPSFFSSSEETTTSSSASAAVSSKEKKQRTPKAPSAPIDPFPCLNEERCDDLSEQDKSTLMKDCIDQGKSESELSQALDCAYAPTVKIKRNRMALIRTALREGYPSPQQEQPGMKIALEYNKRLEKANSKSMNIMAKWNQDHMKEDRMKVCGEILEGGFSAISISISNALASDWFVYNSILNELLVQQENRQKQP